MARTRKDFYMLALGVTAVVVGLVLIGNYIPRNWVGGGICIFLVALGVYLTGLFIAPK